METTPTTVPPVAMQVGSPPSRWTWVEPAVWTERNDHRCAAVPAALETGVKGGQWFSLIDKVYSAANLRSAAAKVAANEGAAGVDHVTPEQFTERLDENVEPLNRQLRDGTYRPQQVRRRPTLRVGAWIPKLGSQEQRPLGIPTVRDRTVQAAVRQTIEPIFERDFAATTAPRRCPATAFGPSGVVKTHCAAWTGL